VSRGGQAVSGTIGGATRRVWPLMLAAVVGCALGLGAAALSSRDGWVVLAMILLAIAGVVAAAVVTRGLAPWARVVLLTVGGYIALGRGFAYLSPFPEHIPLFVGEVTIVAALCLMPHGRLAREFVADGTGRWVIAWTGYGLIRASTWLADMDFTAAKAISVVYYTAFLYFGWALTSEPTRFARLARVLAVVFAAHLVHAAFSLEQFGLAGIAPSAREGAPPLLGLTSGGTPYLNTVIAGFFFLLVWPDARWRSGALRWAGAVLSVAGLVLMQARAGFVAAAVGSVVGLAGPRRGRLARRLVVLAVVTVVAGLALATTNVAITGQKGPLSAQFAVAQLWSIVGVAPTGDTAEFESLLLGPREGRLEIWDDLIRDTVQSGHWLFGLGFARSLLEIPLADGAVKRSPHNGFVAVFGYLGLIGLVLFVGTLAHALMTIGTAVWTAERRGDPRTADVALWLLIALAVNASGALFSVVWDSPVQAAPAYLFMGMGVGLARAVRRARGPEARQSDERSPGEVEWRVG
jgi:O-antigen ligase/polysaccharide polymerase Wzy-like membrane protein